MLTYKVWVQVEKYDEESSESIEVDLNFACTAEFNTEDAATAFADVLNSVGRAIHEARPDQGLISACENLVQFEDELGGYLERFPQAREHFARARAEISKAKGGAR